jgi:hypothetical protein
MLPKGGRKGQKESLFLVCSHAEKEKGKEDED